MEQSSEQLAGCVQSTAGVGVAGGRDTGVHGGTVDTRTQSSSLRVLQLLPGPVPRPPEPSPHRYPKGRTFRRATYPRRLHVQRRGKRRVLPAIGPPQDSGEPQS